MSNELSLFSADKELASWALIRLSPVASVRATSSRRSGPERHSAGRGLGPERALRIETICKHLDLARHPRRIDCLKMIVLLPR